MSTTTPRSLFARALPRRAPGGADGRAPAASLLESLEQRQLMAADLAVSIDPDFTGMFVRFNSQNSRPVTTAFADTLVPGDRISVGLVLRNVGDEPVQKPNGDPETVRIDYYFSTNTTFESSDFLLESFPDEGIRLSAGGLQNDRGTFDGTFAIPNRDGDRDIPTGDYFIIARIVPGVGIGDSNQTNNIAATDDAVTFAYRFGTFSGRSNVTMTLVDGDGTRVTWAMSGAGSGTVSFPSTDVRDRFDVAVTGANNASDITVRADEDFSQTDDDTAVIRNLSVNGALRKFDAADLRLVGEATVAGTLGSMAFNELNGATVTVSGTGASSAYAFGQVRNSSIASAAPISDLAVSGWTDSDSTRDAVAAPWMGRLVSAGNFQASLDLAGRSSGLTLSEAQIGGQVNKGSWAVGGKAGSITAQSTGLKFNASFAGLLKNFTVTRDMKGTLAAKNINNVSIGRDLRAKILAGANLGDDAKLGGSGDDADTFGAGQIKSLVVGNKAVNALVGAGLDPVDGRFKNGDDVFRGGKIEKVTIASTASNTSRFLARRFTGTVRIDGDRIDTDTDPRFQLA